MLKTCTMKYANAHTQSLEKIELWATYFDISIALRITIPIYGKCYC